MLNADSSANWYPTRMSTESMKAEPWLRGTFYEVPPVQRALLHSLEMAEEDLTRWCRALTDQEIQSRPFGLPPVAFQIKHIARSLDRFLSYAEETPLTPEQFAALVSEMDAKSETDEVFAELAAALAQTRRRLTAVYVKPLDKPVGIGRKSLPSSVGGLLVHAAEHTQRHVGQAITTAKIILAQRVS